MSQEWIKTRQTKYVAYAATYIVIIAAVLVVANFLANRYNKSYDATSNKQFTLSDQTKKVIGDLKQDVTIQYFDRPSGMQAGKDLLDRYANLSPKVKVEYVDLLKNPQLARAANITRESTAIVGLGAKKKRGRSMKRGSRERWFAPRRAANAPCAWWEAAASIVWTTPPRKAFPTFRMQFKKTTTR